MLLSQRLLLALVLVMATAPVAVAAPEKRATVLSIGNGDTIRVQKGQQRITVRLACQREGFASAQA
jgi:endonuclease YncB( thermonuclease family)